MILTFAIIFNSVPDELAEVIGDSSQIEQLFLKLFKHVFK